MEVLEQALLKLDKAESNISQVLEFTKIRHKRDEYKTFAKKIYSIDLQIKLPNEVLEKLVIIYDDDYTMMLHDDDIINEFWSLDDKIEQMKRLVIAILLVSKKKKCHCPKASFYNMHKIMSYYPFQKLLNEYSLRLVKNDGKWYCKSAKKVTFDAK